MARLPFLYDKLSELRTNDAVGHVYLTGRTASVRRSFAEICRDAESIAGGLTREGVAPGDRVGILIGDNARFIVAFLACIHGGFVAVPLSPPPTLGRTKNFFERIDLILQTAQLKVLVVDPNSSESSSDSAQSQAADQQGRPLRTIRFDALQEIGEPVPRWVPNPQDPCFIQFTSGSTGTPKGVIVSHLNVAENCTALAIQGLGSAHGDVAVSWLPMYHDMGLVGKLLATLSVGMPTVYISTRAFIMHPSLWMQAMSDYGGTITFAPNFSLALVVKRFRKPKSTLDLTRVKAIGCGAEPVRADTLRQFHRCYAAYGLSEAALMPSYGLAEATLAVSFGCRHTPFKSMCVSKVELQTQGLAVAASSPENTVELVSCGSAFDGHEIAIEDPSGARLAERQVGEIAIRGPSVAQGYFANDKATQHTFVNDRLLTGDLGFLSDGELYICGRKKELIIINGANYSPQDIEWSLESIEGVRGVVVALGVEFGQGEELVIVAERSPRHNTDRLRESVRLQLREHWGLIATDIAVAQPGMLPKTTSGKLRRGETKIRYQQGQYEGERETAHEPLSAR